MIAVYQPCRRPAIHYPELSFLAANIVDEHFDASYQLVEKSSALYARLRVAGTFISGQRVAGSRNACAISRSK